MNWPFPPSHLPDPIGEPVAIHSDLGIWAGRARATAEWHRQRFPNECLRRAIRIAGNQARLAEKIGVKYQSISHWLRRKSVPAKCVLAIEAATDFRVTCHDLRPDRYHECQHTPSAARSESHAKPLPDCGVLRGMYPAPFSSMYSCSEHIFLPAAL